MEHPERTDVRSRLVIALFRWVVYGTVVCLGEVLFYSLILRGRALPVVRMLFQFDWQVEPALHLNGMWTVPAHMLYGQCSLWMFPEYAFGLLLMIEPLSRRMRGRPVLLRALVYG